jgi:hypothetical protein
MKTTRAIFGMIDGPLVAAARSAGVNVLELRLSIKFADTTRRRRPLMVTSNLSGPRPATGVPSRSITWTSTAMRSRLERNVVGGFCGAPCGVWAGASAESAATAATVAASAVSRFLISVVQKSRNVRRVSSCPGTHASLRRSMLRLSTLASALPGQGQDNMRFGGRHTFASCHRAGAISPA